MIENAKENSQRVELKDRIIETASEAFTAHGIKSITMDDIAASWVYQNVHFTKCFRIKRAC